MPESKRSKNGSGREKTQFKEGNKGGPGRPKGPSNLKELQELARTYTADAIQSLYQVATSGRQEASRVAASNALLDRGWGKAAQPLGDGEGGQIVVQILKLSESGNENHQ